jgi:DNA-directed RNA polymerase specialized sigma subunit, sigma24 homolog
LDFTKIQSLEERNMKNYKDSDYALNKYSEGIVYKFADRIVEITLSVYLAENPDKTVEDFRKLKALSDEMYHEQVMHENRTSRLDVPINGLEETEQLSAPPPEIVLIHKAEKNQAMKAARQLLDSGQLTATQRRRFILHFIQGLSTRQIAVKESVSHVAVHKSIALAKEKLIKLFEQG